MVHFGTETVIRRGVSGSSDAHKVTVHCVLAAGGEIIPVEARTRV